MKLTDNNQREKNDRPGEAETRRRMRALFGENKPVTGYYNEAVAARCENGTFVGKKRDGITAFLGIPYALPPTGERRWKAPFPVTPDDGVYEAYHFGHSPIQTEWPSEEGSYYPQSEDCLTLNVWTAEGTDSPHGEGKPVMVFFHGGSYGWGATSDPIYEGHNFVKTSPDIVLVTVEYRVGIFGFMDFSAVPGGDAYRESGNLGLLDHVRALSYIRNNIAAFGGDPSNVTIFGESAGGGTVSLLLLMPEARGLFRRAIAESGSVALTYSRAECARLTQKLLAETGAKTMAELIALPTEALALANEKLNDYNNFPERDGVVLPEDLYGAFARGDTAHADLMIGSNADEVRYWIREMGYYSDARTGYLLFRFGMPVMFGDNLSRMSPPDKASARAFMKHVSGRELSRIVEFYNDLLFRVPAAFQAGAHAGAGGNAFVYYWTYPSAHRRLGACHAVELSYVFCNPEVTIYTGDNVDLSLVSEAHAMWTNFARTGDPSTAANPFPRYTPDTRKSLLLGQTITVGDDLFGERRRLIEPLLHYYFNGCYTNLSFKLPVLYRIALFFLMVLGFVPALCFLAVNGLKKLFSRLFSH